MAGDDIKKPEEKLEQGMTWVEPVGCGCLNLGCLLVILGIAAIIAGILDVFSIQGLSGIADWIWKGVEEGIVKITT